METLRYPARFTPDEDGGWLVWIPDINSDGIGIYTEAETLEEAREMAQDALTGCLMVKLGMSEPLDGSSSLRDEPGWEWVSPAPNIEVALAIRELRQQKKMTQEQAARFLRVPYASFQRWEDPEKSNATVRTLWKVARAFGKRLEIGFR